MSKGKVMSLSLMWISRASKGWYVYFHTQQRLAIDHPYKYYLVDFSQKFCDEFGRCMRDFGHEEHQPFPGCLSRHPQVLLFGEILVMNKEF